MHKKIFKKVIVLAITILLLTLFFGQAISALKIAFDKKKNLSLNQIEENSNNQEPQELTESLNSTELVDQKNGGGSGCGGGCDEAGKHLLTNKYAFAQSFIPSHTILSKISLTLSKSGTPASTITLILSVRESLDGPDLSSVEIDADYGYVTFDFEDITVIPGNMYYMICTTEDSSSSNNGYGWFYSKEDSYSKGSSWVAQNNGNWQQNNENDMYFETYWRDYGPEKPLIDGISEGKAQKRYTYTFSATDPEDNDVFYFIDWGDGKTWRWIGPYESGGQISKSHQWSQQDNYTIRVKAKDIYGVESQWSDPFTISMPKNIEIQHPFLRFLQTYLHHFFFLSFLLHINP